MIQWMIFYVDQEIIGKNYTGDLKERIQQVEQRLNQTAFNSAENKKFVQLLRARAQGKLTDEQARQLAGYQQRNNFTNIYQSQLNYYEYQTNNDRFQKEIVQQALSQKRIGKYQRQIFDKLGVFWDTHSTLLSEKYGMYSKHEFQATFYDLIIQGIQDEGGFTSEREFLEKLNKKTKQLVDHVRTPSDFEKLLSKQVKTVIQEKARYNKRFIEDNRRTFLKVDSYQVLGQNLIELQERLAASIQQANNLQNIIDSNVSDGEKVKARVDKEILDERIKKLQTRLDNAHRTFAAAAEGNIYKDRKDWSDDPSLKIRRRKIFKCDQKS